VDPFVSSLQGIPNVILTPHVGGSTEEAQSDIGRFVALKLGDYAASGVTTMSVNLPQVIAAPERDEAGRSRILHVHRNVPGVLARVNTVLGDAGVNIEGQTLSTRGELGYVITDTLGPVGPDLVERLRGLPETVRLRVLVGD
jgi:D-3-phosphoglycerate dehydrogenase